MVGLRGSWGIECALDSPIEIPVTNRLFDYNCARYQRANSRSLATDEHVRDPSSSEYFLDRCDAASIAQPRINYHQIWFVSSGGGHSVSLGCLDCANVVTHRRECVSK